MPDALARRKAAGVARQSAITRRTELDPMSMTQILIRGLPGETGRSSRWSDVVLENAGPSPAGFGSACSAASGAAEGVEVNASGVDMNELDPTMEAGQRRQPGSGVASGVEKSCRVYRRRAGVHADKAAW